MPNEWTNADSLRAVNTGAVSAGAEQEVPRLSLGGYASSSFVKTMMYRVIGLPKNIEIVFVSSANGEGTGTIDISGSDITWTAPGSSTAGSAVTISNGETKIVEDGADPAKYIRIKKYSTETAVLSGTLEISYEENNAVVMDNVDEDLALAGGFKYRSIGLDNGSAGAITSISVYSAPLASPVVSDVEFLPASGAGELKSSAFIGTFPESCHIAIYSGAGALKEVVYATRSTFGFAVEASGRGRCGTSASLGEETDFYSPCYGVELALETPTGDQITASADEDTAPVGITYTPAFGTASAVTLASLSAGDWVGLHLKRDTAPTSVQIAEILGSLRVVFTAGGTEYTASLSGGYKVANAVQYQLFVSETSTIDFTADPDAVSETLPFQTALSLPPSGDKDYWYAVRYRNRYGLTSLNQYPRKISVSSGGSQVTLPPSSPMNTTLEDTFEGEVRVRTEYDKGNDEDYAADKMYIWASVGSDPDPDVDPVTATRGIPDVNNVADGIDLFKDIGPYASESDLRVIVRMHRTSDGVDDGNTDVVTLTTASGAVAPIDITAYM